MTTQSRSEPKVFEGRTASVRIADASDIDPNDENDTLHAKFDNASSSTEYSARVTELTITDPEASVEVQNHFGGQVKTETPFELVTVDFTMAFKDYEMWTELHGSLNSLTSTDAWARKGGSDGTPGGKADSEKSILFHLEKDVPSSANIHNDKAQLNYLLHNAMFQQMGEISLSADDTAEVTGSAVCLMADRYKEKNF